MGGPVLFINTDQGLETGQGGGMAPKAKGQTGVDPDRELAGRRRRVFPGRDNIQRAHAKRLESSSVLPLGVLHAVNIADFQVRPVLQKEPKPPAWVLAEKEKSIISFQPKAQKIRSKVQPVLLVPCPANLVNDQVFWGDRAIAHVCRSGTAARSFSKPKTPGRKRRGRESQASIRVDAWPPGQGPPSRIRSRLSPK